jgi:putative ABC transport system permease protein
MNSGLKYARAFLIGQGMLLQIIACLGAATSAFLCYTLVLVVNTQPWWAAQYFIPILGMLLGNAISGISVGMSTLLDQLVSGVTLLQTPRL